MQASAPDSDGILHALTLTGDGKGSSVAESELNELWSDGKSAIWVHIDYSRDKAQTWVRNSSALDEIVVEALLAEETRPRVVPFGPGLLICLRGVNLNPGAEPEDMVALRLWIDERRIITSTQRAILSIGDLADALQKGLGPSEPGEFLAELCDRLIQRMGDTVEDLEIQMDDLEDLLIEGEPEGLRYQVSQLRRESVSLKKHMAPQREALSRLAAEKCPWLSTDHRRLIREVNEHLIRHIENLETVRERAALTQEELLSRLSEQLNARMYVLSLMTAIFLPLSFLTGLMGINVGGIPGASHPWAFSIFLAILGLIVLVEILYFRKRKWL